MRSRAIVPSFWRQSPPLSQLLGPRKPTLRRPGKPPIRSYGIAGDVDRRRLPGAARARGEHRRRRAPDARDLRCRLALRGRHLGPAGSPADRLPVRPVRGRGVAVRADPARARRAQPLARALLPALEHHPDCSHGRGRGCRRRVDEPARAAVLHPGDLRRAFVPARVGGRDRGTRLRRLRGGGGRRGSSGPRVRGVLCALPRMHRRAVRLARPQPGPPPGGARARVARGSPDRVPQPPRLRGALRLRVEPLAAQRPAGRADHARPRQLQGRERHARARRRRRDPALGRGRDGGDGAPDGHASVASAATSSP